MAIDATVGGTASNSYVTAVEATAYFGQRLNTDAWDDATSAQQEAALVQAAIRLEQETWAGSKADADQALAWPRAYVEDRDGCTLDADRIPADVKRAQMELALAMLTEDRQADTGLEGFDELRVGPITIKPRHQMAGALPAHVYRFVRPYLRTGGLQFLRLRA